MWMADALEVSESRITVVAAPLSGRDLNNRPQFI